MGVERVNVKNLKEVGVRLVEVGFDACSFHHKILKLGCIIVERELGFDIPSTPSTFCLLENLYIR